MWRSLRVRLAVLGFLVIYVPVLLLLGLTVVTESDVSVSTDDVEVTEGGSSRRSPWVVWTVVAFAPVAAGLAWWLAGRAVRPIDRVRTVAEDIEGSDLSRRIGLDHGPTEVVALAASFDAMLDRLEHAADTQRQLIDEASHELRAPLSVLATNTDVLLAHPDPTVEDYRQGLERSRSAVDRLRTTIEELLVDARGRARTIDRRPADLMAIVRDVVEDARTLAASSTVDVSLNGPEAAVVALDEPTMTRAINNIVDNAIRYAPAGSTVDVRVEMSASGAVISVTDHGPGIPSDEQEHVFERSWSGRDHTDGAGLGLAIAQQIAIAHGGDITLTSPGPSGDGSVFELRLRRQ